MALELIVDIPLKTFEVEHLVMLSEGKVCEQKSLRGEDLIAFS